MSVISLDAQVAVEQHITAHAEHPVTRPAAVTQANLRHEPNRWTPFANQYRRDSNLQAIEKIGFEESRYGNPASLDKHSHASARTQKMQHLRRFFPRFPTLDRGDHRAADMTLTR